MDHITKENTEYRDPLLPPPPAPLGTAPRLPLSLPRSLPGPLGKLQVDIGEDAGGDGEGDRCVDEDGEVREVVEVAPLVQRRSLLLGLRARQGLGLRSAGRLRPGRTPAALLAAPLVVAGRGLLRRSLVEQAVGIGVGASADVVVVVPGPALEEAVSHGRRMRRSLVAGSLGLQVEALGQQLLSQWAAAGAARVYLPPERGRRGAEPAGPGASAGSAGPLSEGFASPGSSFGPQPVVEVGWLVGSALRYPELGRKAPHNVACFHGNWMQGASGSGRESR